MLKKYFKNNEELEIICKIIRSHKGEFCPDKDLAMASAILRMADKIDKINKGKYADFQEKYEKSMKKIKRHFKYNDIKGRNKLEKACEKVVEEVKESLE